jgi:primary-amine oxidase
MTNSLSLGCDCKGAIHYMDAAFVNRAGASTIVKNAICIHEEDAGILFKHTDFRDESIIVTRGRKLIVSHIFTAANYEYCVYWIFHQDGTVQLDIKLTGILNTYAMNTGEDTKGWGTEVYPGVNAHNHQHLFCLRIDPNIDGPNNTVFQVDAERGPGEVGSAENKYGNAFYAKKTKFTTPVEAMSDYNGATSRTWEMANTNKLNPHSKKPVCYKLVSREVPSLLPKEGGLVWKRAGFARHAVHVTKCKYPLCLRAISQTNSLCQTPMTRSTLQVAMSRRLPVSPLKACQHGLNQRAPTAQLTTRILYSGTRSVSLTSHLLKTTPSCLRSQ